MPGYQIAVVVSGHSLTKWPDRRAATVIVPGSAAVFMPGTDITHIWSHDCAQLGIKITPAEIMRELPSRVWKQVLERQR